MSDTVFTFVPADYPLDDVQLIANSLTEGGVLVPGYVAPQAGLLSLSGLIYARQLEGLNTTILPDRNLASRMARIARLGLEFPASIPSLIAVRLMAFAQATDLQIEPSIAFHELAHRQGNSIAHEELAWFRAADRAGAKSWIDVALGRSTTLDIHSLPEQGTEDLAFPLRRWNRNYIVALKIAQIELESISHLQRTKRLFAWMFDDFIFAGPAAVFATMYFSPFAKRRRLIKQLRSADRERAIDGVKNAAWDITHLSDFVGRVQQGVKDKERYIFATADRSLAGIAPLLLMSPAASTPERSLARSLRDWWPPADADEIVDTLFSYIASIEAGEQRQHPNWPTDFIKTSISNGEGSIRAWRDN
ncbi:hypothetical protein NKI38_31670 [Mesorhizobium sp. M0621]|uniref:hypothetical protein n=1 Tax=Mesorhizobium sp. M0621 TaxID=2956974 RepID=UPI00333AC13E